MSRGIRRGGSGGGRDSINKREQTGDTADPQIPDRPLNDELKFLFESFRSELDEKHDRNERIVKISRDITIQSKRVIFMLHRSTHQPDVIVDASLKLDEIRQEHFRKLAQELKDCDQYRFLRAYTFGLQEYIEAVSLLYFIQNDKLISFQQVKDELIFDSHSEGTPGKVQIVVPIVEYLLGIGDLSGELMRLAINSISTGKFDASRDICVFLKDLHSGFNSLNNLIYSRDWNTKIRTLKENLAKVEKTCYDLQLRGSEMPEHLLANRCRIGFGAEEICE